jgi:hypothetical protein
VPKKKFREHNVPIFVATYLHYCLTPVVLVMRISLNSFSQNQWRS